MICVYFFLGKLLEGTRKAREAVPTLVMRDVEMAVGCGIGVEGGGDGCVGGDVGGDGGGC